MLLFLGVLPRWRCSVPLALALCCHLSVSTCSSSSDTLPDTPVSDEISTYSKLGKRINKYYQYQLLVWEQLNEEHDNVREIDTVHTYINGKTGKPSVHFAFRRLMPRARYEGIIKVFQNGKYGHQSLITGWSDFSERQYARTFQRRHPTFEQTVRESITLKGAQFCFGYREEDVSDC
jgi:hypothetical protein